MSDKKYAILRTEKLNRKHTQEIKKRCEHVNRVGYAENVNQELAYLDRCVIGEEGSDWISLFKERYKELEYYKQPDAKKLRSDAVIGVEAVATMSHDMAEKIDLDAWVEATNKWMKEYFGEKNVCHGVLHMDEATPHIHYFITPVRDGKFNARDVMGGKEEFEDRLTSYAKAVEDLGLIRGLRKGYRSPHVDIKELYASHESIEAMPEIFEQETAEEYRERVSEQYKALQLRIKYLEKEIEGYKITQEYASEVETKMYEYKAELDTLKQEIQMAKENILNSLNIGGISIKNLMAGVEHCEDRETLEEYLNLFKILEERGASYLEEVERLVK